MQTEASEDSDGTGASISVLEQSRTYTARADNPNAKLQDTGSAIRTILFEVVGACIGVATMVVAILALRRMPMQRQSDQSFPG